MGYHVERGEPLAAAIKRIAQEQADYALTQLSEQPANRDGAVHEARKAFKQLRAVLRLVRDGLGETLYQDENAAYRGMGRRLADLRDSFVAIEALDKLKLRTDHQAALQAAQAFRRDLMKTYRQRAKAFWKGGAVESVAKELQAARERIITWPLAGDDFSILRAGLQHAHRHGVEAMKQAYEHPLSAEHFHAWRKWAKYLWYHVRILAPTEPVTLEPLVDDLHQLSEMLGEAHDYAVLYDVVAGQPVNGTGGKYKLLALIDYHRARLEAAATTLGERLYTDTSAEFVSRLESYWIGWQQTEPA